VTIVCHNLLSCCISIFIHGNRFPFLLSSLDSHFFFTDPNPKSKNFIKIHIFMIHGNRSPLSWLSEFLNIKIRNPRSPLPAPRSHNSHPLCKPVCIFKYEFIFCMVFFCQSLLIWMSLRFHKHCCWVLDFILLCEFHYGWDCKATGGGWYFVNMLSYECPSSGIR
jgi:hypothetical protein